MAFSVHLFDVSDNPPLFLFFPRSIFNHQSTNQQPLANAAMDTRLRFIASQEGLDYKDDVYAKILEVCARV
jgi:hypothetical protein